MPRITTVKFRDAGKQYDFNAQQWELRAGDPVIVETDRGRALGRVVMSPAEKSEEEAPAGLKNVLRPATEEDQAMAAANAGREETAFRYCQQRIAERKMEMKLVRAEYLFDGSKIIFYFTADGRVDFRELVKDLAHHFHTRIEMRQIGVRDEAKLTGGIGICGRELCCCTFLTEFAPVSVKMAKEQGLALNPTKISGQCGRLLCCLAYEFETYCALRKGLPKSGRKVTVDGTAGEVADIDVLGQTVTVRLADGERIALDAEEVKSGDRLQPIAAGQQPQQQSSGGRKEGGGRPGQGRDRSQRRGGDRRQEQPRERQGEGRNEPGAAPPPPREGADKQPGDPQQPKKSRRRSRNRRRPKRKD